MPMTKSKVISNVEKIMKLVVVFQFEWKTHRHTSGSVSILAVTPKEILSTRGKKEDNKQTNKHCQYLSIFENVHINIITAALFAVWKLN